MSILVIGNAHSGDGKRYFSSNDLAENEEGLFYKESKVLTLDDDNITVINQQLATNTGAITELQNTLSQINSFLENF